MNVLVRDGVVDMVGHVLKVQCSMFNVQRI